jgi:hypothetical protein
MHRESRLRGENDFSHFGIRPQVFAHADRIFPSTVLQGPTPESQHGHAEETAFPITKELWTVYQPTRCRKMFDFVSVARRGCCGRARMLAASDLVESRSSLRFRRVCGIHLHSNESSDASSRSKPILCVVSFRAPH